MTVCLAVSRDGYRFTENPIFLLMNDRMTTTLASSLHHKLKVNPQFESCYARYAGEDVSTDGRIGRLRDS